MECSLNVNGQTISVTQKVRDLGVILDKHMTLKDQLNEVVRMSNYNLRNIAFIRKYLDGNSVKTLVHSCVINRLDYCNSIYYNLPKYQLKRLQRVMNKAARLIKKVPPFNRITPALHWLPINARIVYKICVLTYQALEIGKPEYLRSLLQPFTLGNDIKIRHISDMFRLKEPKCNTDLGFRGFNNCAPRLYNKLPRSVKISDNVDVFKKRLKTFLFCDCYDLQDLTIKENYVF